MTSAFVRSLAPVLLFASIACGDAGDGTATATEGSADGSWTGAGSSSTVDGSTGTSTPTTGDASTEPASTGSASTGAASTGDASSTGETGTTGDGVGPGCAEHVTFATIQTTILTGCGGYIGCHLKPPIGGSLDLTEGSAYASLVGVASAIAPAELRVAPGDSAGSLLYRKLTDELAADESEGGPMPKTMTAMMWARLSDEQIEQVRCWIDEGAPND